MCETLIASLPPCLSASLPHGLTMLVLFEQLIADFELDCAE